MIDNLEKIIAWFKTDSNILTLLSDRMYIWNAPDDNQDWIYLVINQISWVETIEVNERLRIEFRIIWKNDSTNFRELENIDKYILAYLNNNFKDLWFIKCIKSNVFMNYTELKRPFILRDIIFYKIL